ncbi:hypothetical protein K490DRAFT_62960 [Saccharata proteae CBS 121410]|uniref:Uncharacterized protein n=1 Tax=Saccharata proteae CBS 121410 TaxID=1314787 RepID=A0A9P4HYX7_9PEZI|nr:hypothetical protein K490DRAFT_62960 [Saccharata proteae CBS 121410]
MAQQDTTNVKQTIKQAKAAYKKHGPQMSVKERKQLERAAELDRRAERIKEQERKRRDAQKKRQEKEEKERKARESLGLGMATQLAGFNHTQKRLKGAMESFLGFGRKKTDADDKGKADAQLHEEAADKDPWDDDVSLDDDGFSLDGICEDGTQEDNVCDQPEGLGGQDTAVVDNIVSSSPGHGFQASKIHSPEPKSTPPISKVHSSPSTVSFGWRSSLDPWEDEVLDDETLLDAIKDKTPTSQALNCMPVPRASSPSQQHPEPVNQIQSNSPKKHSSPNGLAADEGWDDFLASNTQLERELLASPVNIRTQSSKYPSEPPETPTPMPRVTRPKPRGVLREQSTTAARPVALTTSKFANVPKIANDDPHKLMPPPPKRMCLTPGRAPVPPLSKPPPSKPSTLATFGLSTQLLNDAVDDDIRLTP